MIDGKETTVDEYLSIMGRKLGQLSGMPPTMQKVELMTQALHI